MSRVVNNYSTRFTSPYKEQMAKKPVSVLLTADLDEYVRSLPNRTEWLREAIAEKRQREQAQQKSSQSEAEN